MQTRKVASMERPVRRSAAISVRGAGVRYGAREVLSDVSLEVRSGEFVCLLGPSGCGKTTLLNAMAGFVPVASGSIEIDGVAVTAPGGDRGMVFQEYALFPWFTVAQNVQYGPRLRGAGRDELARLTEHYLGLVHLSNYGDYYPNQLSGGQRQRVAIARALANAPRVLLADEPTGSLDAETGAGIIALLRRVRETRGTTILLVTNDDAVAAQADRSHRLNRAGALRSA